MTLLRNQKERNDVKFTIIKDIFQQLTEFFEITKHPLYEFTHTDLKLENIFYKNIGNDRYKFYVADFDKSSIFYNKIRFYNNAGSITTQSTFVNLFKNAAPQVHTKTFQFLKNYLIKVFGIPTESIVQRYIIFPFYCNWDIVALFISALTVFDKMDSKSIFTNIIDTQQMLINALGTRSESDRRRCVNFIDGCLRWQFKKSSWFSTWYTKEYDGDFSLLIMPLIVNRSQINYRYYDEIFPTTATSTAMYHSATSSPRPISNALLSKCEHKLILSLPAYYDELITKAGALQIYNTTEYHCDIDRTIYFYNRLTSSNIFGTIFSPNYAEIYYNANRTYPGDHMVCKLSRASSSGYLSEYDMVAYKDLYDVYTYFQTIFTSFRINIPPMPRNVMEFLESLDKKYDTDKLEAIHAAEAAKDTGEPLDSVIPPDEANPSNQKIELPEELMEPPKEELKGGYSSANDYQYKYLKYKKKYLEYKQSLQKK